MTRGQQVYRAVPRRIPRGVPLPKDLSEGDFQLWVMREADRRGWHGWHNRDSEGVVMGLHKTFAHGHDCSLGWPDWIFVREDPPGFLIRELKTNFGPLSPHQKRWLQWLKTAGVDADLWRPRDEVRILNELA